LILEQVQQTNKQSFKKTITIKQSPLVYLSKRASLNLPLLMCRSAKLLRQVTYVP